MGGRSRNKASELIQEHYPNYGRLAELGTDDRRRWRGRFTEDFAREDRRRFVTIRTADPDQLFDSLLMYWDVGAGPPTFSVPEFVAVRVDRAVLFRSRVACDDGKSTESLVAMVYSPERKRARAVMFEPDDLDSALAELDLLYDEFESTDRQVPTEQ